MLPFTVRVVLSPVYRSTRNEGRLQRSDRLLSNHVLRIKRIGVIGNAVVAGSSVAATAIDHRIKALATQHVRYGKSPQTRRW